MFAPAPDAGPGLAVFSSAEAATLEAVAARMVAPLDARGLGVMHEIDRLLAAADDVTQHDLKQLLRLFDSSFFALLLDGRAERFTELGPSDQELALRKWRDSRLAARRSGFQALQRLCLAVAYADLSLYRDIGYPGPPALVRRDGTTVGGVLRRPADSSHPEP